MTDQEKREKLKAGLDGHWEYICKVTSDNSFPTEERGRGGRMTISVSVDWTGVGADINAERLWSTTDSGNLSSRKPLQQSVPWHAEGGVVVRDGKLSFEYFATTEDGLGVTKDTYQLFEEENKLDLGLGEFKQRLPNGQLVAGIVKLRKMASMEDFQWAPAGISPGGASVVLPDGDTVRKAKSSAKRRTAKPHINIIIGTSGNLIMGDVAGDVVSDQLTLIRVTPGDVTAFQAALREFQISDGDVGEITAIVQEERPSGDRPGHRAAGWVGGMVGKAVAGTWEFGKNVSADVLVALLCQYYGLS